MAKVVEVQDVCWPFEESPYVSIQAGCYARRIKIDPFPCYAHDVTLVNQCVDEVMEKWPVDLDVAFYLLSHESLARTNGTTMTDVLQYEDGKAKTYASAIYLSGKRIPHHPAMTRYLVAHEYGHVVEDDLLLKMGEKPGTDVLVDEYCQLRGLSPTRRYGGKVWHMDNGEIFANDFRILIAGVEPDFWPHEVKRPELESKVIEWWVNKGAAKQILASLERYTPQIADDYYDGLLDIMERLSGWCSLASDLSGLKG